MISYLYFQPEPDAVGRTMLELIPGHGQRYRLVEADAVEQSTDPEKLADFDDEYGERGGTVYVDDPNNHLRILNKAFVVHNRDDRPQRTRIRSMSVGDIIAIASADAPTAFYVVEMLGFSRLANVSQRNVFEDCGQTTLDVPADHIRNPVW